MIDFKGKIGKHPVLKEHLLHAFLFFMGKAVIPLLHVDAAAFFFDITVDLGEGSAGNGDHLHQQHGGVNAVLTVDVTPHRQTAGGLTADQGIHLRHLGGDIFEAHGNLVAGFAEFLGNLIQHVGGGQIPDHRAVHAAVFDHVIVQQHQDGVGV